MELRDPYKFYLRENRITFQAFGSKVREECPQNGKDCVAKEVRHWDQLPSELLSSIFSYLKPAELTSSVLSVCTKWHDVAFPFIKRLKFGPNGTTEDVTFLVERLPHLESIHIHNRKDFEPMLQAIHQNCKQSDTSLTEISLKVGPRVSRSAARVEGVVIGCRSRYCCASPSCSPDYCKTQIITEEYSKKLMKLCPKLKILELQNLSIRSYCNTFFNEIGTRLGSITHLTIIKCFDFTPACLQSIAEHCILLSHVTLLLNTEVHFWEEIPEEELWEEAYEALIKKRGPTLQVLEIDAIDLSDTTLQALSTATNLHTLTLDGATISCNFDTTAISTLRNLKHLNINDCSSFRPFETIIAGLFAPGFLGQLETFGMPCCREMDDDCLDVISRSCPNLIKVDFSQCYDITDRGVEFIMLRCTKLRVLNLYPMVQRLSGPLRLIPAKTPSLKLLVIGKRCDDAMEQAIDELVARCPNTQVKPDMDGSLLISFI